MRNKKFNFQIYDSNANPLKTFSEKIIASKVEFTESLNGGQGELIIDIPNRFDDAPTYPQLFNFLRVYEITEDYPLGRLLYTGFCSQIQPFVEGGTKGIRYVFLGLVSLLSFSIYSNSFVSKDPKYVAEHIVDNFQSIYPPSASFEWVGYNAVSGIRDGGNIDSVGKNISYDIENEKWSEAMNKTIELTGGTWNWFIDKGGDVFLKNKASTAEHSFTIGKDTYSLIAPKTIETITNSVELKYNGGTVTASDSASISSFGERKIYLDESGSTSDSATAQQIADEKVAKGKDPKIRATSVLNNEYDSYLIRVGQTCKMENFKIGSSVFDTNMMIVRKHYTPYKITLELEQRKDFVRGLEVFISGV